MIIFQTPTVTFNLCIQSRTPPHNSFTVDALLEAEDQRIAVSESPPFPEGSSSTPLTTPTSSVVRRRQRRLSAMTTSVTLNSVSPSTNSDTTTPSGVRRFRRATLSLARVVESSGPRIRVRLVGTDDRNDCWFLVDSDQIRPFPSGESLQPPFGYVHDHLAWRKTLKKTSEEGIAADPNWFAQVRHNFMTFHWLIYFFKSMIYALRPLLPFPLIFLL